MTEQPPPAVVQVVPVAAPASTPVLIVEFTDACDYVQTWTLSPDNAAQQPFCQRFASIMANARAGTHGAWFRWLCTHAALRLVLLHYPASVRVLRGSEVLFTGLVYERL